MEQPWSNWTMRVHDHEGTELFSLALTDFQPRNHNPDRSISRNVDDQERGEHLLNRKKVPDER
jgi:hypothetical protein